MEKKRIWLYCRVAHPTPDDFALDAQAEYLKQFAAQHDFDCVGITREYGSGLTLNRPSLEALFQSLTEGGVDTVLIKDLSRLARDYRLTWECIQAFREQGVDLISVQDQLYLGKDKEHFLAEKSECSYSIFQML